MLSCFFNGVSKQTNIWFLQNMRDIHKKHLWRVLPIKVSELVLSNAPVEAARAALANIQCPICILYAMAGTISQQGAGQRVPTKAYAHRS